LLAVFNHTMPDPPPGACAVVLLVVFVGAAGVDFAGVDGVDAIGVEGVAGFDPVVGVEEEEDVPPVFGGVVAAGVAAGFVAVFGGTPYQVFKPLCPEQAPVLIFPMK